jgi:hypothetical protein
VLEGAGARGPAPPATAPSTGPPDTQTDPPPGPAGEDPGESAAARVLAQSVRLPSGRQLAGAGARGSPNGAPVNGHARGRHRRR